MRETNTTKIRLAVVWWVLPLLLVVLAGCGGRAPMGWSAPVVDDGVLYVGSKTGQLYALDLESQQPKWSFPSERLLAGIYSTPVIRDGTLLFGSYEIETSSFLIFQNQDIQGKAYAVDVSNGQERWHFPVGGVQESEPFLGTPVLGENLAYFTSSDGSVYALDMETGVKQWEFKAGNEVWGGPSWRDGAVYVGSADKNLYALDGATGKQRWSFTAGGAVYGTPHVGEIWSTSGRWTTMCMLWMPGAERKCGPFRPATGFGRHH